MRATTAATHRALTEKEHAHVSRLLWRTTQIVLAKRVGTSMGTISAALRAKGADKLPLLLIDKLMALQPDDFASIRVRGVKAGRPPMVPRGSVKTSYRGVWEV